MQVDDHDVADEIVKKMESLIIEQSIRNRQYEPENEFGLQMKQSLKLLPHQQEIIKFMIEREKLHEDRTTYMAANPNTIVPKIHDDSTVNGGLLAVEMGLGKTLIALSLCLARPGQVASLIVMPKTPILNFIGDIQKFFGHRQDVLVWDRQFMREDIFLMFRQETAIKNRIIICSYDTISLLYKAKFTDRGNKKMRGIAEAFYSVNWHRVIMDESHRLADFHTNVWKSINEIQPGKRWCMSGTILTNKMTDMFSQLLICGLDVPKTKQKNKDGTYRYKSKQMSLEEYNARSLHKCVFTMKLEDSGVRLPPKHIHKVMHGLDDNDKQMYKRIASAVTEDKVDSRGVLEAIMRARQVCTSAYITEPTAKKSFVREKSLPHEIRAHDYAVQTSQKLREMARIISNIPDPEKVIVVSEWKSVIFLARDALLHYFPSCGKNIRVTTGETKDINTCLNDFRNKPEVRVLMMTRVGIQGLNLTEANHVILLTPDWTYIHGAQAIGRVWRLGQTRECHAYILLAENSIETLMPKLCDNKELLKNSFLEHAQGATTTTNDEVMSK